MTMSRLSASRGSPQTRRAVAWYLARPDGFARSFSRTLAEVVRERYQARRQRRRDMRPRVHRGWTFALLRAVSNGVLRDLNTAVVCDEMLRGTRRGVRRLRGLRRDRPPRRHVPTGVARGARGARRRARAPGAGREGGPRRYWIVLVSDHGQSQGATFADRQGVDLAALCASLTGESVDSVEESVESWGRAGSLLDDLTTRGGARTTGLAVGRGNLLSPVARKVARPRRRHAGDRRHGPGGAGIGQPRTGLRAGPTAADPGGDRPALAAAGARAWWRSPGSRFVAVMSDAGPLAMGESGLRWLDDGRGRGGGPPGGVRPARRGEPAPGRQHGPRARPLRQQRRRPGEPGGGRLRAARRQPRRPRRVAGPGGAGGAGRPAARGRPGRGPDPRRRRPPPGAGGDAHRAGPPHRAGRADGRTATGAGAGPPEVAPRSWRRPARSRAWPSSGRRRGSSSGPRRRSGCR